MSEEYQKFNILPIEPPKGLMPAILQRVKILQKRAVRVRFALESTLAGGSFTALVYVGVYAWHSFNQSGFYEYLSLVSSDSATLVHYWRELSLSLIETLPIISLIVLLATASAFAWSFMKTIQNARSALSRA